MWQSSCSSLSLLSLKRDFASIEIVWLAVADDTDRQSTIIFNQGRTCRFFFAYASGVLCAGDAFVTSGVLCADDTLVDRPNQVLCVLMMRWWTDPSAQDEDYAYLYGYYANSCPYLFIIWSLNRGWA